jgi:hypothetical protein
VKQSIILGIGTGRCGTASLAKVLNQQGEMVCSYEEPPLLPWRRREPPSPPAPLPQAGEGSSVLRERFARFRAHAKARLLGDVASFYLPYLEDAIALEPDIRIVCLRRPREEVVTSFCEWLDQSMPLPTNHWARQPAPGWHHDANRTRTFPQYDTQNREEGIRRYWDEYYRRVAELAGGHPEQVRIFDTYEALNTEAGLRDLLSFVGIPAEQQVLSVGTRVDRPAERSKRWRPRPAADNPLDPRRCVILVPFASSIIPPCERALEELERRGYPVRRVGGYAAIDQGRNQMSTDALLDGYEETMWIDADIDFHPDAIDRLRSHRLPIVCGVYPQKGKRALACHVMPGSAKMVFGKDGGLVEILYAATGFLFVRREVYLTVQDRLQLPMCNERFRGPMLPFFQPMLHPCEDGHWYLAEDYAFSERVRQCGYRIMADTTIRLWHVGSHSYGWEDAGVDRERFDAFTLNFGPPSAAGPGGSDPALVEFARRHGWPAEKPQAPPPPRGGLLTEAAQAMLAKSVTRATGLIAELGASGGQVTRYLANLTPRAMVVAIDDWPIAQERRGDAGPAGLPPRLYEAFLAECWDKRGQIVPVRAAAADGLQQLADAGLRPDLVFIGGDPSRDHVAGDLRRALDLFPEATIVGEGWTSDGIRAAVEGAVKDRGLPCESEETVWRIPKYVRAETA